KGFFSQEERLAIIKETFTPQDGRVEVVAFEGLTVDFCRRVGARYMIRGMRSAADFEFEKAIAHNNAVLAPDIETIFLVSSSGLSHLSSTIVREILANRGAASKLVPPAVMDAVQKR